MERVLRRDGDCENLCEERRSGHSGDGAKRVDRALKFALRGRINTAGHQRLNGGSSDSPEGDKGNDREGDPSASGKRETRKSNKAEHEAKEDAAAFSKTLYKRADQDTGNQRCAHSHEGQRIADVAVAPGIAIFRIEGPHGRKGILSEVVESDDDGESGQLGMRTKKTESSERIGHMPSGFCAAFARKRLGKDEKAVDRVGETEACGGPKRKTQIDIAQLAADGGTNYEAKSKCGADEAEGLGAFFRRGNIGDVGEGGGNVRSGDAGNEPADEKPTERGGERHKDIVGGKSEAGNKNNRAAAKAVRPRAEQRGKNELHGGPAKSEITGDRGGAGEVTALEHADQVRENGGDDTESDHIKGNGYEDEVEGSFGGDRRHGGCRRG